MKSSTRTDPGPGSWSRRPILALLGGGTLATLSQGWPRPAAAEDGTPKGFIEQLGDEVMAILADTAKSDDQKLADLKGLLDQNTDMNLVARLVLGRYWRTASDEEREDYLALFNELLMKTMAARLNDYNGQTFEVTGSKQVSDTDSTVATKIIRTAGKPPLDVDWRVREQDGRFAIIDVVAEGVSLVVSQRNEVSSIVEKNGMPGLLTAMRERSDALL